MHGCTLKTPVAELPAEALDDILNGTDARLEINNDTMSLSHHYDITYRRSGEVHRDMQQSEDAGADANKWSGQFFSRRPYAPNATGTVSTRYPFISLLTARALRMWPQWI